MMIEMSMMPWKLSDSRCPDALGFLDDPNAYGNQVGPELLLAS
jgi:hypothetical protein